MNVVFLVSLVPTGTYIERWGSSTWSAPVGFANPDVGIASMLAAPRSAVCVAPTVGATAWATVSVAGSGTGTPASTVDAAEASSFGAAAQTRTSATGLGMAVLPELAKVLLPALGTTAWVTASAPGAGASVLAPVRVSSTARRSAAWCCSCHSSTSRRCSSRSSSKEARKAEMSTPPDVPARAQKPFAGQAAGGSSPGESPRRGCGMLLCHRGGILVCGA
mmetsp:Transcript_109550/g.305350  ORF Transcript_109550/g.305350 Transcript_109550/m.305350 type:complete len:220 (+) Transcript_109550:748-1407(+)